MIWDFGITMLMRFMK